MTFVVSEGRLECMKCPLIVPLPLRVIVPSRRRDRVISAQRQASKAVAVARVD